MLEGQALAVFRGERLVFRDLDFGLDAGGALLLTGPNGAGKSTLLRLIAGLLAPAAGRLLWRGEDALADPARHAGRIAYLGHQDAIKPGLSTAENLAFAAAIGRGSVDEALAALDLTPLAALPARLLSAGQRRRLALARLLLAPGPVWLLDEPTLGLDTASVARLGALLARHRARGGMVIAATHLPLPLPGAGALTLSPPAASIAPQ
ncbi:MAG: heme ABC exporter ATP-binding protein CcmA [Rhodospirillales bacterium]|nr:heme ABC exporter ATP-binding protein CcmA [Rhodospirillales bacterium]